MIVFLVYLSSVDWIRTNRWWRRVSICMTLRPWKTSRTVMNTSRIVVTYYLDLAPMPLREDEDVGVSVEAGDADEVALGLTDCGEVDVDEVMVLEYVDVCNLEPLEEVQQLWCW